MLHFAETTENTLKFLFHPFLNYLHNFYLNLVLEVFISNKLINKYYW